MTQRITADNYFSIVPEWVLYADISALAVRLYATLQRYADKDSGGCHPSRKTLADRCCTTTKSIDRALKELVALGAVTMHQRTSANGDLTSNHYTVITNAGVETKTPLPRDINATRGRDKINPRTIASMNQSQEQASVKTLADEWWQFYKTRTGGKTPTGKRAFFALQSVITAALDSGWSVDDVRNALTRCATVPSVMQFDRELAKVVQSAGAPNKSVRRLPVISGDESCVACSGSGLLMVFNDSDQKWEAKKCSCYQRA